jgi:hypothetical protein
MSDRGRGEKEAEARSTIQDRCDPPATGLTEMHTSVIPAIHSSEIQNENERDKQQTEPYSNANISSHMNGILLALITYHR